MSDVKTRLSLFVPCCFCFLCSRFPASCKTRRISHGGHALPPILAQRTTRRAQQRAATATSRKLLYMYTLHITTTLPPLSSAPLQHQPKVSAFLFPLTISPLLPPQKEKQRTKQRKQEYNSPSGKKENPTSDALLLLELDNEVIYGRNTLAMFINSPVSVHAVTARPKTKFTRRYINVNADLKVRLSEIMKEENCFKSGCLAVSKFFVSF